LTIHLINPSDSAFGTAVITPRWLYVLATATPIEFGDPVICDETLESLIPESISAGDVVGIGIHTGNALRGYAVGRLARERGAYVVFGGIHGIVLSLERVLYSARAALPRDAASPGRFGGFLSVWGQRILTFNLLCLSLVFFRAPSLRAAVEFLGGLFNFTWRGEYAPALVMLCLFALPLFLADLLLEASEKEYPFAEAPYAVRTGLAVVALVVLALFSGSKLNAFIYFQF